MRRDDQPVPSPLQRGETSANDSTASAAVREIEEQDVAASMVRSMPGIRTRSPGGMRTPQRLHIELPIVQRDRESVESERRRAVDQLDASICGIRSIGSSEVWLWRSTFSTRAFTTGPASKEGHTEQLRLDVLVLPERRGSVGMHDLALAHDVHVVGELDGERGVLLDQQHGGAFVASGGESGVPLPPPAPAPALRSARP